MPTPKARYEIVADDKTAAGWRDAMTTADKFSKNLKTMVAASVIPAVSIASVLSYGKAAIGAALEVDDLADKMETTVSSASKLTQIFKQLDGDTSSLEAGYRNLSRNIAEGLQGQKAAVAMFERLGTSARELVALRPEDQLAVMAEGFARIPTHAERTQVALEAFGKGGAGWLPVLSKGGDEVKRFADNAVKLDDAAVAALDRAAKATSSWADSLKYLVANSLGWIASNFGEQSEIEKTSDKYEELGEKLEGLLKTRAMFETLKPLFPEDSEANIAGVNRQIQETQQALAALNAQQAELRRQANAPAELDAFIASLNGKEFAAPGGAPLQFATNEELAAEDARLQRVEEFEKEKARIQELGDLERASIERTNEMVAESADEMLERALEGEAAIYEAQIERIDQVSEYEREAQRRTQNIISRTIHEGFDNGFDGALESFVEMLRDMAIEAAAANLAQYFTGNGSSENGGGWAGFLAAIGSYFGGGGSSTTGGNYNVPQYAAGGSYPGGQMALVGEKGPELFLSKSAGTIIPNDKLGGMTFAPVTYINIGANNAVTREEVAHAVQLSNRATLKQFEERQRRGYPK